MYSTGTVPTIHNLQYCTYVQGYDKAYLKKKVSNLTYRV